jgi:FixJ family two-component response regulator
MKSAAGRTVFIIDDDRGMRQAIQDLVESVGLRAESFATGEEFLSKKRAGDPSCLVLDVRLPQIMRAFRSRFRLCRISSRVRTPQRRHNPTY